MGLQVGMDSVFGLHHLAHAHNAEAGADSLAGQTPGRCGTRGSATSGRLPSGGGACVYDEQFRAEVRGWLRELASAEFALPGRQGRTRAAQHEFIAERMAMNSCCAAGAAPADEAAELGRLQAVVSHPRTSAGTARVARGTPAARGVARRVGQRVPPRVPHRARVVPGQRSVPVSALWACARWCSPKTESMPAAGPSGPRPG